MSKKGVNRKKVIENVIPKQYAGKIISQKKIMPGLNKQQAGKQCHGISK